MATSAARGALIVVEGLDRAGKSTQVARLAKQWPSPAEAIRFPDRTTAIGQNLNAYLTGAEAEQPLPLAAAHLLFSANRWEAAAKLQAKLLAGTTLIVDRYSYSGAVYTAAKASLAADHEMTLDWTWAPEAGLPAPDLLLFLDISEHEAAQRGGFGQERYETSDMQRAVRTMFHQLLDRLTGRGDQQIRTIDAGQTLEAVTESIWAATADLRAAVTDGRMPALQTLKTLPTEH